MAERNPFLGIIETLFGRKKRDFSLRPIRPPFDEWQSSPKDRPVFHVFLREGDARMINNISMIVKTVSVHSQLAKVVFTQSDQSMDGLPMLRVKDIRFKDGLIQIGDRGEIACSKIDFDSRVSLYMAMPNDIDVHSIEHQRVKLRLAS